MNQTVDKCSTNFVQGNSAKACKIKEKVADHRNGLVNGVSHKKKSVIHGNSLKCDSELSIDGNGCLRANNVEKLVKRKEKDKKNKTGLDSNENISENESNETLFEDVLREAPQGMDPVGNLEKLDEISRSVEVLDVGGKSEEMKPSIKYIQFESELQMPMIMKIIQKDLSEPYSIYTYRYFIHNWPKLCFLAMCEDQCVGAIVCKLDLHRKVVRRGYIAMLAVDQAYRKLRIGSTLVQMAINEMIVGEADEVVLETEVTNKPALQLYEKLGFVRDKRLFRYYLNGVDALRLKLWLR